MKANETTLIELIGVRKRVFSIPVYQRNYDWKPNNCKQLFYDIENIVITGKDHFLGTIVYIPDRSTATCPVFIVIDGQQRLTSVMLLIKALHDSMINEDIRLDIEEEYLKNSKGGSDYRLKLKPIETDQNVYEKLMMNNSFKEDLFDSDERNTTIYKNYQLFKDLILNSTISAEKLYEAIYRLEIVEIQLDKENPQEVFESLNSTGLDLSNADLLRNYLLMSLDYDKQQDLYRRYWVQIEKMLGNDQIEAFMTYYLILKKKSDAINLDGKRAHINSGNLYRAYKLYLDGEPFDTDYIEPLLSDMKRYAMYYKNFVNFDDCADRVGKMHKEIFTHFNSPAISITLMYFYNMWKEERSIDVDDYLECLEVCRSYLFRSKVAGHNVSAQFCALLIQYFEKSTELTFINKVWNAFNSGNGRYAFPSDEDFMDDLQNKDLYLSLRATGVRYLLYQLEEYSTKEVVSGENVTIEHIMPQTLSEQWKAYLYEARDTSYDLYIHRLGNLTLTKENSKLSNNLFFEKVREYAESNYKMTRNLAHYEDWTSTQIKDRSRQLALLATKIWRLPERYNLIKNEAKINKRSDTLYTLDDDLEQVAGTKPVSVLILGKVIRLSTWKDVYVQIYRELYEKDPMVFVDFLSSQENAEEQIFSNDGLSFNRYEKIGAYYLNISYRNTPKMLGKLKVFVDYFDMNSTDTSLSVLDEIVFEIS
ncbi:MAG: DUF262 domain-containing HNH endonuclease family protein [Clostridia bacterium]|nr:DUF262 domain-containing HNH endonuclease family protein [Clostridia bacterium]